MVRDVEHFFIYFLAIWISSFEKPLFSSFAHFFIGLLISGEFSCFLFLFFIIFTFTHMYIHCLGHLPLHPASRQNLSCPLVLWFCWRDNIRDNKKDTVFLLVWDKDSRTERFLALLPHTCVLQPTLVHLYQISSLLPSLLPIVASLF
jgi:hypothetical protein